MVDKPIKCGTCLVCTSKCRTKKKERVESKWKKNYCRHCTYILTNNKYILLYNTGRIRWNLSRNKETFKLFWITFRFQATVHSRTWHSYVPSSSFTTDSIFSFQLFGYWNSILYLWSPEYVWLPTVSNSRPLSPGFRRTHDTCFCVNKNRIKE